MPGSREEDFKRNNAFTIYDLYGQTPAPGVMKLNFGRPFLGHYYYILSLSDICMGVEMKIFQEIMHFHYMTYMATP